MFYNLYYFLFYLILLKFKKKKKEEEEEKVKKEKKNELFGVFRLIFFLSRSSFCFKVIFLSKIMLVVFWFFIKLF